jgi:hypothetical protein
LPPGTTESGGTCTAWTATVGKCHQCDTKKGACSIANPSSITSAAEITFYGDATCSSAMGSVPITVDGKCYAMPGGVGSVKAGNVSAIIGGVLGAFFFVLIVSICLCKRFGCCGKRCCCGCGPPEAASPAQPAALVIASPPSSYGAPGVYPVVQAGYAPSAYPGAYAVVPPPGYAPSAYYAAPPPGAQPPGAFYAPIAPYAPGGSSAPAAKAV